MVIITGKFNSLLEQDKKKSLDPALKNQVRKTVIARAGNEGINDWVNKYC